MKTTTLIILLLAAFGTQAQTVKPCDAWQYGYAQSEPKMPDGTKLNKYVLNKLEGTISLKDKTSGEVGLYINVNCKGEFSFVDMNYPNNNLSTDEYNDLLKKTESIVKDIKVLAPANIGGKSQDFVFKLVVRVKKGGKLYATTIY